MLNPWMGVGDGDGGQLQSGGGFPRQTHHCVSLGSWFWLQMRRGRARLSLSGAVSKLPSGHGMLMSGLVLSVCLFFRKRTMRWMERESREISADRYSPLC